MGEGGITLVAVVVTITFSMLLWASHGSPIWAILSELNTIWAHEAGRGSCLPVAWEDCDRERRDYD